MRSAKWGCLGVVAAAAVLASTFAPPVQVAYASAAEGEAESIAMPRNMNDISADVLGRGYEQRIVLEHESGAVPAPQVKSSTSTYQLAGLQTIGVKKLSCPKNTRLRKSVDSPGRIVPQGVQVQEPGWIGVSAGYARDFDNHIWGNPIGAADISMTNWDPFVSHTVTITLHCETLPTSSMLKIYEPAHRGGDLITSFPASSARDTQGPNKDPYYGELYTLEAGLPGKRVAVAGDQIYVADRVRKSWECDPNALALWGCPSTGGEVRRYDNAGALQAQKSFGDNPRQRDLGYGNPADTLLSLDAYEYRGKTYVAAGKSSGGVELMDRDLNPIRTVHPGWDGRAGFLQRDMVSMVKFFEDENGRLLLASGKMTQDDHALYVTDVATGEVVWKVNKRSGTDPFDFPVSASFGRFGDGAGQQLIAVSWFKSYPDRTSYVKFYRASDGEEVHHIDRGNEPVLASRFFTTSKGEHRFAASLGKLLNHHEIANRGDPRFTQGAIWKRTNGAPQEIVAGPFRRGVAGHGPRVPARGRAVPQ